MNKKNMLGILLDLIFLVVFNTVFFVLAGAKHPASVWISYGFIHLSYLMVLITPFLIRKSSNQAVFGFSLYAVSEGYFFAEFVLGLIFILIGSKAFKASLSVQVILAGIYAVMLISNLIANETTADQSARHEDEVAYIKNASSKVKILIGRASDKKANREIERVYDLLHASPSRSVASVKPLEEEIMRRIAELEDAVAADKTADILAIIKEITAKTEERNREISQAN